MSIALTPLMSTGTLLKVDTSGGASSPTYTTVAGFTGFSGLGGGAAAIIDVTSLNDTAHVKLKGLQDGGNIKLDFNYVTTDPGQLALKNNQSVATGIRCQIVLPTPTGGTTGDTFAFTGLVQTWEPGVGVDKQVTLSVSLEVTGLISLTPAA